MVRKKLNGWQRLWVVAAVLLALRNAISFARQSHWQTIREAIDAMYAEEVADEAVVSGRAGPNWRSGRDLLEAKYPIDFGEFIEEYKDPTGRAYPKYLRSIESESLAWWQYLEIVCVRWFVEICGLYALGLVIRWVRRGFITLS